MVEMKTINYRGGVLRFRIPSTWREEYDERAGAIFYEDGPDSGTLRVQVMTMQTPPAFDGAAASILLATGATSSPGDIVAVGKNAYTRFAESAVERGTRITTFYWLFANPVPPDSARVVTFSYTVPEAKADSDETHRELALLHDEITKTEFASQIGRVGGS